MRALLAVFSLMASLMGQSPTQFSGLTHRPLPVDTYKTNGIACGDVDGDGDLDLVIGNEGASNVLFLNDSVGTFTASGGLPKDTSITLAVALFDADGDGDLDLLTANASQDHLYLNDGKGNFTDVTLGSMPADTDYGNAIAIGDIDGDNDLDVIIGNFGSRNRALINDGKARFSDGTATHLPNDQDVTSGVALVDVDADKDLDLVFANRLSQNRLLLNDAKGRFTDVSVTRMPGDSDSTLAVAAGDVDGDGDIDVVFANDSTSNELYLNVSGAFLRATSFFFPRDNDASTSVQLADVDGDGDLDVVFGNGGSTKSQGNTLYLNDGKARFQLDTSGRLPPDTSPTAAVYLADLAGDPGPDLVEGNLGQSNLLFLNVSGRFVDRTAPRLPPDTDDTSVILPVDVNGDGNADLVVANAGAQNRLYLGDGDGGFVDATAASFPFDANSSVAAAAADVDNDGDLDLVFGTLGIGDRLYRNDGTGKFQDVAGIPASKAIATSFAFGDVDNDKDKDLVVARASGQNSLYLNDGKGKFTDVTALRLPVAVDDSHSVALGDVDNDNDIDIVFGNNGSANTLYLNLGGGVFARAPALLFPPDSDETQSIALYDFDQDGDLDVFLVNGIVASGLNKLYLNDGKGRFTDVSSTHMPTKLGLGTTDLAIGDVDGDGDLDAVIAASGSPARLYLGDGHGKFVEASNRLVGGTSATRSARLVDVDTDGDLDLVWAISKAQNQLHFNLLRQLDSATLATVGHQYVLDLFAKSGFATSGQLIAPYVSLSRLPNRVPLPPFGSFSLDPTGMIALAPVAIPAPSGRIGLQLAIPDSQALVGKTMHFQGLVLHSTSVSTWRLSNVASETITR